MLLKLYCFLIATLGQTKLLIWQNPEQLFVAQVFMKKPNCSVAKNRKTTHLLQKAHFFVHFFKFYLLLRRTGRTPLIVVAFFLEELRYAYIPPPSSDSYCDS